MVSVFVTTNAKFFWFQPSRCVTAILPCSVSRNTGGFTTSFSPGTAYTFQSNSYPRIFTFGHRNTCTRINFSPFPFFSLFFVFFFGGGAASRSRREKGYYSRSFKQQQHLGFSHFDRLFNWLCLALWDVYFYEFSLFRPTPLQLLIRVKEMEIVKRLGKSDLLLLVNQPTSQTIL